MSAIVSNFNNILHHRDYSHDYPDQKSNIIKRVALAAVPFLSLHRSLRVPMSIAMGTLRIWNTSSKNILGTMVAIAALAGTIFQHKLGSIITTIHDILIEINHVRKAPNLEEALKGLFKILNNLVYLALMTYGGLELSIIAFAMQTVLNLIQSRDEFKKGRWIEGVANLLMAGVRIYQTQEQFQHLIRKREIEAAIKRIPVGELHEKWKFPSDHLPVGIEVNGVKIISWNVLNTAYMEWVKDKDSQGINGSMITDLDVVVNPNGLTMRDIFVADMVQNMMSKGHVVALQECGKPFLEHLQGKLPSHWDIVKSFNKEKLNQEVILYNKSELTYQSHLSEVTKTAYPSAPGRELQNAYFSHAEGKDLRIINAHIPGDPNLPCREEYARYVHQQHKDNATTIGLGDNNFERHEMIDAFKKAGFSDFSLHSPWKTNIDPPTKESKAIDHIFKIGKGISRDLKPEEVLAGGNLKETIGLLNQN